MEREILQFLGLSGHFFGLPRNTVISASARFDRRGREITPANAPRRRRADRLPPSWASGPMPASRGRATQPRWAKGRQISALLYF